MGSDHHHGHVNGHAGSGLRNRLLIAFGITSFIVIAQAIGSVITGSLELLTDTAHALSDSTGLLVAVIAATMMLRPPNNPATAKPPSATTYVGARTTSNEPAATSRPPARATAMRPHRSVIGSPRTRPTNCAPSAALSPSPATAVGAATTSPRKRTAQLFATSSTRVPQMASTTKGTSRRQACRRTEEDLPAAASASGAASAARSCERTCSGTTARRHATRATTTQTAPLTTICVEIDTPVAAAVAPTRPPVVALTYHRAWKEFIADRPRHCSTRTPWTFWAASTRASTAPARSSMAAKDHTEPLAAATASATARSTEPTAFVRRTPSRRMTRPPRPAATSAPVGKATTSSPNWLSVRSNAALISGYRGRRALKSTPLVRNISETPVRARAGEAGRSRRLGTAVTVGAWMITCNDHNDTG